MIGIDYILLGLVIILISTVFIATYKKSDSTAATSVTKACCKQYAYGTYEDFVKQMSLHKWEHNCEYPQGYFGIGDLYQSNYVHASIFKFDNVGMIFTDKEFYKVKQWLKLHEVTEPDCVLIDKEW